MAGSANSNTIVVQMDAGWDDDNLSFEKEEVTYDGGFTCGKGPQVGLSCQLPPGLCAPTRRSVVFIMLTTGS